MRKREGVEHFQSFDLVIIESSGSYRAQVAASPAGSTPAIEVRADGLGGEDSVDLDAVSKSRRGVRSRCSNRRQLRETGRRLFDSLFVGAIDSRYRTSIERVRSRGQGLRIRLRLESAPELASLAWESMWDTQHRSFLADERDVLIVRDLATAESFEDRRPIVGPLHIAALLASPRDEPRLACDQEWRDIGARLRPLTETDRVVLSRIEPPTLVDLSQHLGDAPCDVLHIVSHGEPAAADGGLLVLETKTGDADRVDGDELARALSQRRRPMLLVINACHGGSSSPGDAFDGLAQHLLAHHVPAVVAMRSAISDDAAVEFAGRFYRELAAGCTIEAAMVEARRALSTGRHRTEWSVPALFLRAENLTLVPHDDQVPPAAGTLGLSRTQMRWGGRLMAMLLAALLIVFMWQRSGVDHGPPGILDVDLSTLLHAAPDDRCPLFDFLPDLRFEWIEGGELELTDKRLKVEDGYCIATHELSRRDVHSLLGGTAPDEAEAKLPFTFDQPSAWLQLDCVREEMTQLQGDWRFRLPTPDEWELAARANATTDFFWGDDPLEIHRYGNSRNKDNSDDHEGLAPVGTFDANDFGLFDVHGNVAEWVTPINAEPRFDQEGRRLALRAGGHFDKLPSNCAFGKVDEVLARGQRDDTGVRLVADPVNSPS